MAEPVRARRLTDEEGRRLQQIVRRGKHGSVRVRRAMIIMASAAGTPAAAIARLVAADEDTVRDVIHAFNAKGLAALDPQWAGGRPRLISDEDIEAIVTAATRRPEKLGLPFTHWSVRKLAGYLASCPARPVVIGRERLRQILASRGLSFQRTRTWKESHDPDKDAKLDRIEYVTSHFPGRCFAFDQFGPLSIRPCHGSSWARQSKPLRLPATYHRTHGIRSEGQHTECEDQHAPGREFMQQVREIKKDRFRAMDSLAEPAEKFLHDDLLIEARDELGAADHPH